MKWMPSLVGLSRKNRDEAKKKKSPKSRDEKEVITKNPTNIISEFI